MIEVLLKSSSKTPKFITGKVMPACTWNSQPHSLVSGKPRKALGSTATENHKFKATQARERSWVTQVYSRQPRQAALDRCLFVSDSDSASNSSLTQQISTYGTYIAWRKLLEFLSIFSVSLDWIHAYAETWICFFRVYWTNTWFFSYRLYILDSENILRKNSDIF